MPWGDSAKNRFTPAPTTTTDPSDSLRIPPTFTPSGFIRSFGHFTSASTPTEASAVRMANPATSGSVPSRVEEGAAQASDAATALSALIHPTPVRPRPASCRCAVTRTGRDGSSAKASLATSCVDGTVSTAMSE